MAAPLMLLALLLSVASAALFLFVGRTIARRPVSAASRPAQHAFVVWWACLGAVSLVQAVLSLPSFPLDLGLFLAVTVVSVGLICAALGGLMFYLVFLYTARGRVLVPIAVGYTLYFVLLVGYIVLSDPVGIDATEWGPELRYANEIEGGPLYWAVLLLLLVPPLASALAYLSLYWKAKDPVLRRRILLVSLSIVVWFGSSFAGTSAGVAESTWWPLASRVIGLAAASVILFAYAGLGRSGRQAPATDAGRGVDDRLYEPPRPRVASLA